MSSSICPHFTQNAWKKDLCSNCFKSKDEHKQAAAAAGSSSSSSSSMAARFAALSRTAKLNSSTSGSATASDNKKTDYPNRHKMPAKSSIKKQPPQLLKPAKPGKPLKVAFCKHLSEVIGYGGEWSDNDSDDDDDHDFMNLANEHDDNAATSTDDEDTLEMKRITRANTDFNMINGNLLGDAQENIKKSFAALKLGAPQVDKEGKKQTLLINVVPFGGTATVPECSSKPTTVKAKFECKTETETKCERVLSKQSVTTSVLKSVQQSQPRVGSTITSSSTTTTTTKLVTASVKEYASGSSDSDGKNSPPIERAMEKSLLDEISETLEQQQHESKQRVSEKAHAISAPGKIKFEISSLSETHETKPFLDLKKPIARNPPITKEHAKPKVNIAHKYSDTDSNGSDVENSVSAYYDVVETQVSYENLPDGKCNPKEQSSCGAATVTQDQLDKAIFSSSQYITDMLLSSKTRAASYNLHEGNFMTSKITSDGLIVTKCSSDDALDSTGSSFDGSSDEETSYNMTRSESDSGIGISIGSDYKNINAANEQERLRLEKKLSVSTNNSDYEDIQVADQRPMPPNNSSSKATYSLEKCRELHGEPDGSADPDGSLETKAPPSPQQQQLPALPKSPPPTKLIDARPSFLHGLQKQHPPLLLKKPDLPAKPAVSAPLKTFISKRQPNNVEQQVINQLQLVMSKSSENLSADAAKDDAKLKKGRAPNPPPEQKSSAPPTPERDYNMLLEFEEQQTAKSVAEVDKKVTADEQQRAARPQAAALSAAADEVHTTITRTEAVVLKSTPVAPVAPVATEVAVSKVAATSTNTAAACNIYARNKLPAAAATSASNAAKNTASPVIREKDKRERATVNPKFRSLNTFATQRSNVAKNLQLQGATSALSLKQPMTPEPTPRSSSSASSSKNLSMSQEYLAPTMSSSSPPPPSSSDRKFATQSHLQPQSQLPPQSPQSPQSPQAQKSKTKFSIKRFLRMGASKTTDHLHKKDGIYSEICTGDDSGVVGKPRLVIIHPIDINPTAVEVVKDITKTSDAVTAQTVAVVTAKPPAPPLRATADAQRAHEINKPARPPPPKSAELRRKQKIDLSAAATVGATEAGGSIKCKSDNVYANLGEIRSSIAPRKPERTASMREREAQLELARKRHVGMRNENADTISICSSNGDNVLAESKPTINPNGANTTTTTTTTSTTTNQAITTNNLNTNKGNSGAGATLSPQLPSAGRVTTPVIDGKPPSGSRTSTFERKKTDAKIAISNKLEIFEQRHSSNVAAASASATDSRPSSLKDSVRKINNTIDSYLKDKRDYENMYELVKTASSPPPPPARTVDLSAAGQRLLPPRRNNLYSDTASIASYTRSEYGPVRNYGLNSSLANIPRIISASYCGSEVGEFDIYSPYSYYGSEAGGDVATDINDSVWGIPSAIKNRTKATNRLRMRKGRSVVHKNIEDNYTAVVVANHEALAQVLDQLQQSPVIPPALRPLANAINLRFEDFTILDGAQAFVVGKKAFHAAVWTTAPVTLALSADCNQLSGVGGDFNQLSGGVSGVLNPITEFCDLVPSYHLPLMPSTEVTLLQATISVLPRLQLDTLQSIGGILKGKSQVLDKSNFNFRGSIPNLAGLKDSVCCGNSSALRNVVSVQNLSTLNEECSLERVAGQLDAEEAAGGGAHTVGMPAFDDVMTREVSFIMLQLVNGMKNLQSKAIEEMPLSLSNVVLSKDVENKDAQARLCVLQGNNNNDEDESLGTLCKCSHLALTELLPTTKITPILADILQQERAESLSKAKAVLEFVLWGPSDVVLSGAAKERELALQRWLDLERATVLHGLVRTRVELTVYDECHLMFLVRSTAKMMNDAAKIVCGYQQQLANAPLEQQQD